MHLRTALSGLCHWSCVRVRSFHPYAIQESIEFGLRRQRGSLWGQCVVAKVLAQPLKAEAVVQLACWLVVCGNMQHKRCNLEL